MSFRTVPAGATIIVDGQRHAAPFKVSLTRKDPHTAVVSKEGYRTIIFYVRPEWDGIGLVGNLIIPGGSLGLVADHFNGAEMNFYKLADIKLFPSTQPTDPPMVLNDFKGHLLTDDEMAIAIVADRQDRSKFFRGEP